MSSSDEDGENVCLPLALLILVGGGLAIGMTGFFKLKPFQPRNSNSSHLCALVRTSEHCTFFNYETRPSNVTNKTLSTGEWAVYNFVGLNGVCVVCQLVSFFLLCLRISFCVSWCHLLFGGLCGCRNSGENTKCILAICQCRFGWIVFEFVSGITGIVACIYLGFCLSPSDVAQIDAFKFCVINALFNIAKVVLSIVYHKKIGCPPSSVFIGTNLRLSDMAITTHTVEKATTTYPTTDAGYPIYGMGKTETTIDHQFQTIDIAKRY